MCEWFRQDVDCASPPTQRKINSARRVCWRPRLARSLSGGRSDSRDGARTTVFWQGRSCAPTRLCVRISTVSERFHDLRPGSRQQALGGRNLSLGGDDRTGSTVGEAASRIGSPPQLLMVGPPGGACGTMPQAPLLHIAPPSRLGESPWRPGRLSNEEGETSLRPRIGRLYGLPIMPSCLIALGSNLGDRAENLRQAVFAMSRLPHTRVVARSAWHETPPVGGPAGQGLFLNAAAILSTELAPSDVFDALREIETALGRERMQRWAARSLDLDVLLYDSVMLQATDLAIPHPRMTFRRFVLKPAAEVAPWMIHPECRWTVQRLLDHLDGGAEEIAVAAADDAVAQDLISQLSGRLPRESPRVLQWSSAGGGSSALRPKLILAAGPSAGVDSQPMRRMLHLPADGPLAWIGDGTSAASLHEALAAVQSVWPALAT